MAQRISTGRASNQIVVPGSPGPYIAKVVSHLDQTYMGALQVQLLKTTMGGDNESEGGEVVIVNYASPFFGATTYYTNTGNDGYESTQQSYGFWAVPPDVGTRVLVTFVEGRRDMGFWFACLPDPFKNFMVPDGRPATEITTDGTPNNLRGKKLPAGEYNKKITDPNGTDPSLYAKPYNKDFTEILEVQGLLDDEARGTTTTSARREIPSAVFGINTPGPLDKRVGSPKGPRGVTGRQAEVYRSRLGGSSFVMDDGDDKFVRQFHASDGPPLYINKEAGEFGGDETILQNELVRIRTRTGHQILLHNSEDLIYIANSRGTAWIELTSDGKIDIHAQDSISIMSDQDINFTAERDFNVEAGRNINMKASARWSDGKAVLNDKESGRIHLESVYDFKSYVGRNASLTVKSNYDIVVKDEMRTTVEDNYNLHSNQHTHIKSDSGLHLTSVHSTYITAQQNFYTKAGTNHVAEVGGYLSTKAGSYITSETAGSYSIKSAASIHTESSGTTNLKAGQSVYLDSASNVNIKAAGIIAADAPQLFLNSGLSSAGSTGVAAIASTAATAPSDATPINVLSTVTLPYMFPGAQLPVPYESILTRAPQHEPWTHHENMNPQAFKSMETDREAPGELPSNDRVLTPDTFLRNTAGRKSSGYVNGSGGFGIGGAGGFDSAIGTGGSNSSVPPAGQGPLATIKTKKRGLTAQVAAVFQENFQGFIDELEATGYEIKVIGGYAFRNAIGQSSFSYHASGAAIDINPSTNGYYKPKRTPNPTDMPANTGDIARKWGLGWGGEWRTASDAMHFSAAKSELGAYPLERNGIIPSAPADQVSKEDDTTTGAQ
jgi:uncharacterized protein (DUF2345 family)